MAKKVDHEQRRDEIVQKATRLFSKVGYDNVSLIMVAAACGISRTILYRYFCSKREVMDAAIERVTNNIEVQCVQIMLGKDTYVHKLEKVCHTVTEVMFKEQEFLIAVFDYVIGNVRAGADMTSRINLFTQGTRKSLELLLKHGIKTGELNAVLQDARAADAIYSSFESSAMRIVLGTETSPDLAKRRFSDIIRAISAWK